MRRTILAILAVVLTGTSLQLSDAASAATTATSAYVQAALADRPVALLQGLTDLTGNGAAGTAVGQPTATKLPNGDPAIAFNGKGQYLQFADRKAFEVDATGVLTVEFWMRPDALQFADEEGSGYVYTMGKGNTSAHEWYTRMYSKTNAENRPNRISGYVFNPAGGLGAGSYFQDSVTVGQWIHVALVINANAKSTQYPLGYTRIYKNGVLRDTDSLKDYDIVPKSGTAPLRIGTGYLNSFFQGAVGNVAFYDRELSAAQLSTHYQAISKPAPAPEPTTTTDPTPTTTEPTATTDPAPTSTTSWSTTLSGTDVKRGADQLIRYTPAYGKTTGTNQYGFEAAVVDGKVITVQNGVGNMAIPTNGYVLSGHGTARQWLLDHAKVGYAAAVSGTTVTVSTATTTTTSTTTGTTTTTTTAPSWSATLNGTDVKRGADQLIRYTPAYGKTTGTNQYGFEAAVVGGKITTVQNGVGNMAIPANGYVLSGHGTARQWLADHTKVGSAVTVSGGTVTVTAPVSG